MEEEDEGDFVKELTLTGEVEEEEGEKGKEKEGALVDQQQAVGVAGMMSGWWGFLLLLVVACFYCF